MTQPIHSSGDSPQNQKAPRKSRWREFGCGGSAGLCILLFVSLCIRSCTQQSSNMAYLQGEWKIRDDGDHDPNRGSITFGNESYSFANKDFFGGGGFHDESANPFFNNPFRSDLIRLRFDGKEKVRIFRREGPDRMVELDDSGTIKTVYIRRK